MSASPFENERRRSPRIHLQVPLFIRGRDDSKETFMELAKTLDISAMGALIASPRALVINETVTLTIPSPSLGASSMVPPSTPPIMACVKRQSHGTDVYMVGVEFLNGLA